MSPTTRLRATERLRRGQTMQNRAVGRTPRAEATAKDVRLQRMSHPTLKDLVLAPEPCTEDLSPPRREIRRRPVPEFA